MIHFAAFAMALIQVWLKASQQINVIHQKWARIPLFSYGLGMSETLLWAGAGYLGVSGELWQLITYGLALGTGGWMGAFIAMWQHNRDTRYE